MKHVLCGFGLLLLAACTAAPPPSTTPKARPSGLAATPPQTFATPSPESRALARYYTRKQANSLTRGLMRADGGAADTPYSNEDLLRNFERIAFFDEHSDASGLASARNPILLRRWTRPVRVAVAFGK